jgi:hypothetical protein
MSARRNHAFVWLSVLFVLIVLFTAAPLISALIATGMAEALGCTLPTSDIAPCLFMGAEVAGTLTLMVYMAYFAFITIPMGTTALAIWLAVACVVILVRWLRRGREA